MGRKDGVVRRGVRRGSECGAREEEVEGRGFSWGKWRVRKVEVEMYDD